MTRGIMVAALAMSLSSAPVQCKHDPDPGMRREDTAGDVLWALSEDFRARHDDKAADDTLRFLTQKYPSNRHAAAAREILASSGDAGR